MKFVKKNLKLIIILIIVILLVSGTSIYATYKYFANEVKYTDDKSVASALDELYANKKEISDTTYEITTNNTYELDKYYKNIKVDVNSDIEYQTVDSNGYIDRASAGTFSTKTLSIPAGKEKIYIYSTVSSTWGAAAPTITSNIITGQSTTLVKDDGIHQLINTASYISIIETNGNEGNVTINFNCAGGQNDSKHGARAIIFY